MKVDEALERIGLPDIGPRRVSELSGGQKQRVAIARCMVLEPDVLLLDEPLGALDLKLREHMKIELKKLQAAFDTTFVYITHDQSEALVMSDTVAVMNSGRFEQVGPAQDLYYRPATPFVAGFVGEANRWTGRVEPGAGLAIRTDGGLTLAANTRDDLAPGDTAQIFVRPEAILLARDGTGLPDLPNRLSGRVASLLFNGAASRILLDTGAGEVEITLPQSGEFATVSEGDTLHAAWSAEATSAFRTAP